MPLSVEQIQWPIVVAVVVGSGAFLAGLSKIARVAKEVIGPVREILSEHDVLWEDYNIRTGGEYRRSTGRGAPPEPEDYYRKHHRRESED